MILKDLKKRFAVTEFQDLGLRMVSDPLRPGLKMDAYVSECVMRLKTGGSKTVRFRVYVDEKEIWKSKSPQGYRSSHDLAALFAVRQVLDQL